MGEARGLTEHYPPATEWDEGSSFPRVLDPILHSPLSIRIRVYPDLVASEVTVGVQVGGAPGLDADHVHIIAIWPCWGEPSEPSQEEEIIWPTFYNPYQLIPNLSLGNMKLPATGACGAVIGDGAGWSLDMGTWRTRPFVNNIGNLLRCLENQKDVESLLWLDIFF